MYMYEDKTHKLMKLVVHHVLGGQCAIISFYVNK